MRELREMTTHDRTRTHLPERNLDVLRAVAVLLVLADHVFSAIGHDKGGWNWNWALGRLGVLLFFVHTSLVLMSSLERGGFAKGWVPRFYLRRAFRIYPLAIVVVLIAAMFRLPPHVTADGADMLRAYPSAGALASNLLLVQNLTGARDIQGVLWSLPLEVQMYVLLPLCFVLARRGTGTMIAQVLVFLSLGLVLQSALVERVPGLWRLSVFIFGPCFISGVLAYHLLRRASVPRAPAWTWPLALVAVAAFFALLQPTAEHPALGWWPCITLAFLIPLVAEMRASRMTSAAHEVAKYSYGIYLAHVPILWLWLRAIPGLPTPARWLGVVISLFIVPVILFRTIEDPMIRYGRTIARKLSLENAPEPPVASEVGAP